MRRNLQCLVIQVRSLEERCSTIDEKQRTPTKESFGCFLPAEFSKYCQSTLAFQFRVTRRQEKPRQVKHTECDKEPRQTERRKKRSRLVAHTGFEARPKSSFKGMPNNQSAFGQRSPTEQDDGTQERVNRCQSSLQKRQDFPLNSRKARVAACDKDFVPHDATHGFPTRRTPSTTIMRWSRSFRAASPTSSA